MHFFAIQYDDDNNDGTMVTTAMSYFSQMHSNAVD